MDTQSASKSRERDGFQSPWLAVSSSMRPKEIRNVAIIGAGVAGLCTAKTLMMEGLRCTIFERNAQLGGVWAQGYSNFGVQVQKELYEIPDWPLGPDMPNFTPGPAFQAYLQGYADHFGITPCIRFGASVTALDDGDERGWRLTYRQGGEERTDTFDLVVVSVGLFSSRPNLPHFPGEETFHGDILHISEFKSREQLKGKRVAVLGYGKSATDAAVEAAAVADQTTIIFRQVHWPVPRKLAGILPFKWGMFHRLTNALLPLYQRPSALERTVHGVARPAVWLFWRLVEVLLRFQFGLGSRFGSRADLVPRTPVEIDCFGEPTMLPRPEFFRLVRRSRIDVQRTEIVEYQPDGIVLRNGISRDIDVLVLASGWTTDYGFLPDAVRERLRFENDGYYLYRHVLHPDVPNLVFIGSDATTFSCILTVNLQARWLAELLRGRHRLPSREVMLQEISDMKAWKRGWMPYSAARGARIQLHMLHYHDELLQDFGVNPRVKTGALAPLKELIGPYQPSDYRAIVSGSWRPTEESSSRVVNGLTQAPG